MKIKLKLREVRINGKLTQKEFSQICNISQSSISAFEANKKSPTLRIIEKIANALNVHPCDLIEITDDD